MGDEKLVKSEDAQTVEGNGSEEHQYCERKIAFRNTWKEGERLDNNSMILEIVNRESCARKVRKVKMNG